MTEQREVMDQEGSNLVNEAPKNDLGGEEPRWRHFNYRGHLVMISKMPEQDRCEVSFRDVVETAPAAILSLDEWEQFARSIIDAALSNPNMDEETVKEELARPAKYVGTCSRTGQAFGKGTMILRGPKGREIAEGWTIDTWIDPTSPPNICFREPYSGSGHKGLMLSTRVNQPLWDFISGYFEYHGFPEGDWDDEERGGDWHLSDMWDLRLVETILGISLENRYGIRLGTEAAPEESKNRSPSRH